MTSLRIALSFLRVPRFFVSLFLLPLFIGLVLFYVQLLMTGAYLISSKKSSVRAEKQFEKRKNNNFMRQLIYGSGAPLAAPTVCRWVADPSGRLAELPPNEGCSPDRLDIALHVNSPQTFDVSPYLQFLSGNFQRVHLCKSCTPDLIIDLSETTTPQTSIRSIPALMLLSATALNDDTAREVVEAMEQFEERKALLGKRVLFAEGLQEPVVINQLTNTLALTFSIASLFVIALYLALKAHRKVLDYFARSGALLPMVSSTGQRSFYGAIWSLTGIRVAAFMMAGVPLLVGSFVELIKDKEVLAKFSVLDFEFWIWLGALFASLALATVVASIADLKHRHNFLVFLYRYIPLIFCALGAIVWSFSFIFTGEWTGIFRGVITAMPILGTAPILVTPVFRPSTLVLVMNLILTVGVIVVLFRKNSRWFAAHLEDL